MRPADNIPLRVEAGTLQDCGPRGRGLRCVALRGLYCFHNPARHTTPAISSACWPRTYCETWTPTTTASSQEFSVTCSEVLPVMLTLHFLPRCFFRIASATICFLESCPQELFFKGVATTRCRVSSRGDSSPLAASCWSPEPALDVRALQLVRARRARGMGLLVAASYFPRQQRPGLGGDCSLARGAVLRDEALPC